MPTRSDGAKKLIGDFSPKLVELTDGVLFDDVWERKELSKRDRSLITVAALIALNRPDQLRFHLGKAVENGVKKEELIEAITHLAFYSGWPNAMTAVLLAKELFEKPNNHDPCSRDSEWSIGMLARGTARRTRALFPGRSALPRYLPLEKRCSPYPLCIPRFCP